MGRYCENFCVNLIGKDRKLAKLAWDESISIMDTMDTVLAQPRRDA
jgi:hypothetical protein